MFDLDNLAKIFSKNKFGNPIRRGKPGAFPDDLFEDKIVTDGQQSASSQALASGEHILKFFEKRSPSTSYGSWLHVIRIDTICKVVIIVTVGKIGNSLLSQTFGTVRGLAQATIGLEEANQGRSGFPTCFRKDGYVDQAQKGLKFMVGGFRERLCLTEN